MVSVRLLGALRIDVPLLLQAGTQGLGRSLSARLDARRADLNTPASHLALLGALKAPDATPESVLLNPGALGQHTFFTFLVAGVPDVFTEALEVCVSALTWARTDNGFGLGVLSGTLQEIQTDVVTAASDVSSRNLRELSNQVMALLEAQGLSRIWSDFDKRRTPDGSYKLLEKK